VPEESTIPEYGCTDIGLDFECDACAGELREWGFGASGPPGIGVDPSSASGIAAGGFSPISICDDGHGLGPFELEFTADCDSGPGGFTVVFRGEVVGMGMP